MGIPVLRFVSHSFVGVLGGVQISKNSRSASWGYDNMSGAGRVGQVVCFQRKNGGTRVEGGSGWLGSVLGWTGDRLAGASALPAPGASVSR